MRPLSWLVCRGKTFLFVSCVDIQGCHFYPSLYQLGSFTHFKDFVWLCLSFRHQQHHQQTSYWLLGSIIGHCCCIWRAGTRFECFKAVWIPPSLSPLPMTIKVSWRFAKDLKFDYHSSMFMITSASWMGNRCLLWRIFQCDIKAEQ